MLISVLYKLFVCLRNFLSHFPPSLLFFSYAFFLTSLLVYFLTYVSTLFRIDPFRFQAGGRRRRPTLALVFFGFIICCSIFCYGCMFAFAFVVFVLVFQLSQEIGWEERLWNDLFCIGWDVKRWLSQSGKQTANDTWLVQSCWYIGLTDAPLDPTWRFQLLMAWYSIFSGGAAGEAASVRPSVPCLWLKKGALKITRLRRYFRWVTGVSRVSRGLLSSRKPSDIEPRHGYC